MSKQSSLNPHSLAQKEIRRKHPFCIIYNDTIKKTQELVEENTKLKAQVTELSEGSEELAKVLRSYHDSNQELADENQQLRVEIMIKESQLKERERVILDYKDLLKEAI